MGYRSDVKSVIYGDPDELKAFVAAARLENNEALKYFNDKIKFVTQEHNDDLYLLLEVQYIKWYEEFPPVKAWMNLLQTADDADLAWEFIRVGEEPEDIEHDASGNADDRFFYASTTIESDL